MRFFLQRFALICGVMLLTLSPALAQDGADDDARLRETIKQVIRENPKLLYDTINDYVRQQKIEEQKRRLEASFENRLEDDVQPGTPVKGAPDAPVTIIEYTDFQCPYCARGAKTLDQILEMYAGKVRLAFKSLPLAMHKQALPAAKAALAAHQQGKFWPYHNLLFANASQLNDAMLVKFAQDLALDVDRFNRDRQSDEIAQQIAADKAQAAQHNFRSTPMFIANGVVIRGAQRIEHFKMIIDRLLKEDEKQ